MVLKVFNDAPNENPFVLSPEEDKLFRDMLKSNELQIGENLPSIKVQLEEILEKDISIRRNEMVRKMIRIIENAKKAKT